MTGHEIVQALRCVSNPCESPRPCQKCKYYSKAVGCEADQIGLDAADAIERLTAENAELLEIAKNGKDCDTCKHCEVCVQPGIDIAHWCDRCVEKCPCHGCGGDHWEWRGLPGAPEEGDKHGTTD